MAWWQNLNAKARTLMHVEAQYVLLRQDHEKLQAEYYQLEHDYMSLVAEKSTKQEVKENLELTGSKVGRSPASITYQVPPGMLPEQEFALAFTHMREKRYGEAAMTFDAFLWIPEGAVVQTANAFYTAGVAWFEVKNYKKAKQCFSEALVRAEGDERAKVAHKVDLWMRVIDRNMGTIKEEKESHEES
jgi:TolA-binding protein